METTCGQGGHPSIKGNDVTLTVGKHTLKVPASKKQALIDGGYNGRTVVLGIRPEDVHDSQAFISNSPDSVIESTIKVYARLHSPCMSAEQWKALSAL